MRPTKHTTLSVEWNVHLETAEFSSPKQDSNPNQILVFGDWFKDGKISATITPIAGQVDPNWGYELRECAVVFRYEDGAHFYLAGLGGFGKKFFIAKVSASDEWRLLEGAGLAGELKFNETYNMRVECAGDRLALFSNDVPILNVIDNTYSSGFCGLRVNRTEARFDKVDIEKFRPKCFVIMPFDPSLRYVYEVISGVVKKHGMDCHRADDRHISEPIVEDVKRDTAEADVVVVDFTNRNPNVYFEAGLAEAWKKKWIVLAQSADDLAFDVQHVRSIIYSDRMGADSELKERLENALKETLGTVRGAG